jgi:hypothetical protein
MKPQSAKAKGRRLQQWFRDLLLRVADGILEEDDVRSTSMGASGDDLLLSPHAQRIFPIATECKNQESLSIWKSLEQACAHARERGLTPVLVFKRNRSDTWAALPAEDLAKLYADLYRATWDQ